MTTKGDKVRTKVAVLLGQTDPPLTHAKIAEMAACSKKTVQRIAHSIRPELEEVEAKLETYRALLRRHLPPERRVARLKELAEQGDHLPTALKALERADAIDGLLRPPEQEDSAHPALFSLPAGTELRLIAQVTNPCRRNEEGHCAELTPLSSDGPQSRTIARRTTTSLSGS